MVNGDQRHHLNSFLIIYYYKKNLQITFNHPEILFSGMETEHMLMKPRRWLGYTIYLNDLFAESEEILDRFEVSEIPLSDTFGSSSDPPTKPLRFILLIGPGVEIDRLNELLELLEGMCPDFIQPETDKAYRKNIYIGCNDSNNESIIPLSPQLKETLKIQIFTPAELAAYLINAQKLKSLKAKGMRKDENRDITK